MRNILLIGAGRSSSWLIKYLLDNAQQQQWHLTVADLSVEAAKQKIGDSANATATVFDITDADQRKTLVSQSDIVISLLPPHLHIDVAKGCINQKKHLVTASYVSAEMRALHVDALKNDVLLLNECGLDPGIDHMSAMQIIDRLKAQQAEIISFKSYAGGLVAPESNDNSWGYKFSWNPRNVILAGQGTAKYIEHGKYRYIPYTRLFNQIDKVEVEGFGIFDGYANRDSLGYRNSYSLMHIPTMLRGTLRQDGFCNAWNVFANLGITDDSFVIEDSEHLTYAQLVEAFLPAGHGTLHSRLAEFANIEENGKEFRMIESTGILDEKPIGLKQATPAQILQNLLEQKWKLKSEDRDMIIMKHEFRYKSGHDVVQHHSINSTLVVKGEDSVYTAMAKTVGLPLGIATKLILDGEVKSKGVLIPVTKELYEPVLRELTQFGVVFKESSSNYDAELPARVRSNEL